MLKNARTSLAAMALVVTLPFAAVPAAAAETPIPPTAQSVGAIDEQALAQYFAEIDNAQTEEEAYDALVNFLGEDAANQAIKENSASGQSVSTRGAGTFLTCVKGKASDDIKSVFDINVVAAAIGQQDYVKAAKEAVKHLAKQGIKRNAAALTGMFAYWGWQCRGSW